MANITFQFHERANATSLPGSSGKSKERFEISCFPKDKTFLFRCRTPKQPAELEPLNPKGPPPRETKCCLSVLPRFVEMTLNNKRVEVNIRSLARRCDVKPEMIYDACVEKRLVDLMADIGLPLKWRQLFVPTLLPEETINSIIPFMAAHWREWKKECEDKKTPSLFFPLENGRKCDIEYFEDGSIFVYYVEMVGVEKQKAVAVDLSGRVYNPEWKEIANLQQFLVYHACAELFQNAVGILRIYKTSQYPELNRYHVLQERYKFTFDDFLSKPQAQSALPMPPAARKIQRNGGSSLRRNKYFLSSKAKIAIAQQLLRGLAKLHEANIAHFAIQPTALFIHPESNTHSAEAAIGSFEYARVIDPKIEKAQIPTSMKPPFLAPELRINPLYQNQIVIPKNPYASDVYSLGEALRQLFEIDQFPRDSVILIGKMSCEDTIAHTIDRMLNEDPYLRITAAEALQAIKDL